ncbi:E3 ubiquitin-protein ligase TRIM36-like isoform X5 [Branchiostoma floridae x Branchiostoma belcheri]
MLRKVRRTLSRRTSRSGNEPVTPGTPSSKHSRIPMPSFKSPPEESSSPESTSDVSPSPVSSSGTSDSRSRKASSSSDLSSFANMERELRCPVCSEFFTQPLVLPCQHNICHRCAKEILYRDSPETLPGGPLYSAVQSPLKSPLPAKVRRGSTPGPLQRAASFRRKNSSSRLSTPTGPKSPPPLKEFPCPKCQEGVELGPKGINGLYRNFILETIVERYKFQARKAGAIACQSCKPRPPADATKTCLDCQASFCNECFKTVHIWGTPKAQHEYVGPTSSFRPRALLCVEHETEKVSMYCQACKRPVCHLCKLGGSHANHKFHHMNTAYKNIEEKLRSSLQILKDKQEKVEEQKRVVMEKRENSKKAASLVKDNIMKAFDSLHAILDDRKSVLLEKAEKVMSAQESHLDAALAQTREMMGVSGLIEYVEQVLKENNHACFLQTATGLCKRVKEATEMKLPTDLDVTCESLTLDVRREEELLSQLDFLQAPNKVDLCKDGIVAEDGQADVTWNPLPASSPPVDSLHVQYWKMAAMRLIQACGRCYQTSRTRHITDQEAEIIIDGCFTEEERKGKTATLLKFVQEKFALWRKEERRKVTNSKPSRDGRFYRMPTPSLAKCLSAAKFLDVTQQAVRELALLRKFVRCETQNGGDFYKRYRLWLYTEEWLGEVASHRWDELMSEDSEQCTITDDVCTIPDDVSDSSDDDSEGIDDTLLSFPGQCAENGADSPDLSM